MDANIVARLEQIRQEMMTGDDPEAGDEHDSSEPGEGGAENVSDINDTFDDYVFGIVDAVQEDYELSDDEALDFVFAVADGLVDDGTLPEIPEPEELQATAEWLGKAKSVQFGGLVLAAAEAEAAE